MVDKYQDPLLTPRETARHLRIPESTMYYWLSEHAAGAPLVHRVEPVKRGRPSVPFVAVIEAYVLRTLRADLGLKKSTVREAAEAIRQEFDTPYGLATRRIVTDGIDIFIEYAGRELARAADGQHPIKEMIEGDLRYISWDIEDDTPSRLRLRQYSDIAPVIIDPRFAWGAPVIEANRVPVDTVVDLWRSGESIQTVADEYGLTHEQAEAICRTATEPAA
ncbi:MAG TPA: DUF433 domain-containing protein [Actinophytocola sp.]|nr:DUF433 domain-containing protein [Actinophytocola sp.]